MLLKTLLAFASSSFDCKKVLYFRVRIVHHDCKFCNHIFCRPCLGGRKKVYFENSTRSAQQ